MAKDVMKGLSDSRQDITVSPEKDHSLYQFLSTECHCYSHVFFAVVVMFPALTQELRQTLVKDAQNRAEDQRLRCRSLRQDILQKLKKSATSATEDDMKRARDRVQSLCDEAIKTIDKTLAAKEKELLQ